VLALVGRDRLDLWRRGLALVDLLLVTLERGHEIAHGLGPEDPGEQDDDPDARPRAGRGRRNLHAGLAQLRRPDLGVTALVGGDPVECPRAVRIDLDRREGVVKQDGVALEMQVGKALGRIEGHEPMLPNARLGLMTARDAAPLRYLTAADVSAAMPPLPDRLRLAELTLTALVRDAELPPKIGVHPRPDGSFAHAMPAHLRGADAGGADDLLGIKWIAGFPANRRHDLPAIHGLVLLTDATTGMPTAILDAGPITAERTAAISGVAVARFAPEVVGRDPRVAVLGAGVQARSHLEVLGHVLPGLELIVFDRHPDRATALAAVAGRTPGIQSARPAATARDATRAADVVVTVASFAPAGQRQPLT